MTQGNQTARLPFLQEGHTQPYERRHLVRYISLKLAALDLPTYTKASTEFLGLTDGHHSYSHHGGSATNNDAIERINTWEVEQFAYLVRQLKAA